MRRVSVRSKIIFVVAVTVGISFIFSTRLNTGLIVSDKISYIYDYTLASIRSKSEVLRSRLLATRAIAKTAVRGVDLDAESSIKKFSSQVFSILEKENGVVELIWAKDQGADPKPVVHHIARGLSISIADKYLREQWNNESALTPNLEIGIGKQSLIPLAGRTTDASGNKVLFVAVVDLSKIMTELASEDSPFQFQVINILGQTVYASKNTSSPDAAGLSEQLLRDLPTQFDSGVKEVTLAETQLIVGYDRGAIPNLVLASVIPKEIAFAAAGALTQRSITLAFLAFLFTVGATLLLSKSMTSNLRKVWAATHRLATGDFDARVEINSWTSDETTDLAQAFNSMADRIDLLMKESAQKSKLEVEKKTLEILLNEQANLTSANRLSALGEMAAGIAHEINNPLAIISAGSRNLGKLIERIDAPEDQKKRIVHRAEQIQETAFRISKITESLLRLAREDKEEDRTSGDVSTTEVMEDVLNVSRERFDAHGIRLIIPELSVGQKVQGNRVQLGQVFLNLIRNGFDAVEGAEDPFVTIEYSDRGDQSVFRVIDNGRGVNEADQDKIFQPFFTTKEVGKGTGLGLSISRAIVESFSGTLTYHQENGLSVFEVVLPRTLRQNQAA